MNIAELGLLPLVKDPDPILRTVSEKVEVFNDELRSLAAQMFYTMRDHKGCGLSAVQVRKPIRLMVLEYNGQRHVFVNPVITGRTKHTYWSVEGCLSVDSKRWGPPAVRRSKTITVDYQDLQGEPKTIKLTKAMAAITQHEIDHMDGILFIDRRGPK